MKFNFFSEIFSLFLSDKIWCLFPLAELDGEYELGLRD